jgi:membrane protein
MLQEIFQSWLHAFMEMIRHAVAYAKFIGKRFAEDRCFTVAGSLTYTTLLAVIPLFTVTITLTSKWSVTKDAILMVKNFALKNFVPEMSSRVLGVYFDQFAANAAKLTVIGLVIIIATAVFLLFTIDSAFNDIWRAKRRRAWWKRLSGALLILAVGPLLIAASLAATSIVISFAHLFDKMLPWLDDGLIKLVPSIMTFVALFLAYRLIPCRFVPARHAIAGAIIGAILFEAMKHAFVYYITRVPTYSLVYGAFATLPIFLLWMFCCWMVVLIGAEVAATLSYFRHPEAHHVREVSVDQAMRVLHALAAGDQERSPEELRAAAPMPIDQFEDTLHQLIDAGLVEKAKQKLPRYRLCPTVIDITPQAVQLALEIPRR